MEKKFSYFTDLKWQDAVVMFFGYVNDWRGNCLSHVCSGALGGQLAEGRGQGGNLVSYSRKGRATGSNWMVKGDMQSFSHVPCSGLFSIIDVLGQTPLWSVDKVWGRTVSCILEYLVACLSVIYQMPIVTTTNISRHSVSRGSTLIPLRALL